MHLEVLDYIGQGQSWVTMQGLIYICLTQYHTPALAGITVKKHQYSYILIPC